MGAAERALARLEGRMAALRRALLAGDLAAVAALGCEIEGQAADLTALAGAEPAALRRLGEAARHNARLLAAARDALAAVRGRLGPAAEGSDFATYDAAGRRAPAAAPPRLERRA
jgi:hypothetical protein